MLIFKFKTSPSVLGELRRRTDDPLEYAVEADDGSVLFAGPLPPEYGGEPFCVRTEDGGIILTELGFELMEAAWMAYEADHPETAGAPPRRQYRTRKQAAESGALTVLPDRLALPSRAPYENALTFNENPTAFLLQVMPQLLPELHFTDGTLYFRNTPASKANLVKFRDRRMETVRKLDVPMLNALYSILMAETMKRITSPESLLAMIEDRAFLTHGVTLYRPDFLRMLGHEKPGKTVENAVFAKIMSFEGILGGMEVQKRGRTYIDYFPVLRLDTNEPSENVVSFSSVYMNRVIVRILKDSMQKNEDGSIRPPMKNGKPFLYPNHVYTVRSSVVKERNKRAVELLFALAVLIDKAGDNVPHITARNLVSRCPELNAALEAAPDAKTANTILRRAFERCWTLMREQTILEEAYEDIRIPDCIPTTSTLDETIRIPHKGKKPA